MLPELTEGAEDLEATWFTTSIFIWKGDNSMQMIWAAAI